MYINVDTRVLNSKQGMPHIERQTVTDFTVADTCLHNLVKKRQMFVVIDILQAYNSTS